MKKSLTEWLSIASNVAILGGIALVAIELQQNQILVRAQLASEVFAAQIDTTNALIGDSPEVVLGKACLRHEDLTPEDQLILKRIIASKLMVPQRGYVIDDIADLGNDWEENLRRTFAEIFSIQFTRDYYAANPSSLPEEFMAIGDAVLASLPPVSCASKYSRAIL